MHHIGGSLSLAALPHAIRSQQDASTGHPKDCLCLAAKHCDESTAESHVLQGEHNIYFAFSQQINSFLVALSFPGSRLGAGERHLPDSGSSVQARRLYCLLLHTAWRDAAHLLPDRSPASQTATESRRWTAHVGSDARLGKWLAGTGARIG